MSDNNVVQKEVMDRNFKALGDEAKREHQRMDEAVLKISKMETHIAELEIKITNLTQKIAILEATSRGHGPSVKD